MPKDIVSRRLITSILHWTAGVLLLFLLAVDHRIYGCLGWAVVALTALLGHAVFHLWRHTTLRDWALRRIKPNVMHQYL